MKEKSKKHHFNRYAHNMDECELRVICPSIVDRPW